MKTIRWIIGAIVLLGLVALIILMPPRSIFFIDVYAHQGFVHRAADILIMAAVIMVIGFTALLSVASGKNWYIDIGIAWGLQSFIGSLAYSKYMEGRTYDD
jgi:multicomponent Na+:H+ antiporter subunit F